LRLADYPGLDAKSAPFPAATYGNQSRYGLKTPQNAAQDREIAANEDRFTPKAVKYEPLGLRPVAKFDRLTSRRTCCYERETG
jgi:hypothetical protein